MADAPHPTTAPQAGPGRRLAAPAAPAHRPPAPNPYDELPYDSHPFSQTHPARLATVATLFDLAPAPVETCRVLELGCAAGGNIATIGEMFPGAEIVGVDLSGRQIADGQRVVRAAGLTNVSLRHASITDIDAGYGTFDYIVCHGVFSWVPDPVRRKILAVCSANLKPSGVAYVSYNTYPGWHMRGMLRDMMRFHADRFGDSKQKVEQARALIDFLASSTKNDTGPYGTLLRQELESLRHQADHYLYHEHLEEVNDPLYFHQFVDMARTHNLRYLGEARLQTMVTTNFAPDVRKAIATVATDQIQTEQYLDFVRNRMFRETLLVHPSASPNWVIRPDAVRTLHVSTTKKPADDAVDLRSTAAQAQYSSATGMTLTTTNPVLKAAMRVLGRAWPGTVPFGELDRGIDDLLGRPPDNGQQLSVALLNTYLSSNLIELTTVPVAKVGVSEKPVALATARARLEADQSGVASRRHELVRTNDLDRRLLPLLDGTRDRDAVLDRLVQLGVVGELNIHKDNKRLTDPVAIRAALAGALDQALERYAASCLLKA
ncbi:Methyltransferase type 12 OS=Rhodopirellula baltica SWK14 GN=RBSWK_05854 PE=4 SV=1: Methyltransf_31: MethyTransf_Reg [Gemmataceae bacterium]|nr:Methyltransferase type 12 OS=Rhodopirellula baltica SWK14 GN=RBSWK_05854 PE=4 SV=1: Methyltransf_31: MethyTransf_Reg [Gemmataceae bacterium]VTT99115.1 Methyltransferase type 12 OS=Rhodopirellula baltica SWK14 GN=RBSWK_05854 PE=4 SV=1: Methyltransf_31: MethyTransf_Reg [Gemmataceae bacterium]